MTRLLVAAAVAALVAGISQAQSTEAFSGEIAGSDIKVWLDRRGPESAITLTRMK